MPDVPLSLYLHFPWCVKKCPYCDFNSHTSRKNLPEQAYVNALIQDLRQQLSEFPGRMIQTVFMGGGTPSLISPAEIQRVMEALEYSGRLEKGAEVTLEANPGTLDETYFEDYLRAGINRLSVGVQSFDDGALEKIGRIHSARQAISAIVRARQAGFNRVNLDLMYGLPGQSVEGSRSDIELALSQPVDHLSVYQLTIEPNTRFAVHTPRLPDADLCCEMHQQAQELLQAARFEQYEVSAYTKGSPCQHNLNYWRFGDYLAGGAGAHGKVSGTDRAGNFCIKRYSNFRHPEAYMQAAKSGRFAAQSKVVPEKDRDLEFLMNALRLREGFELPCYMNRTHGDAVLMASKLKPFFDRGWLRQSGNNIRATETGFRFLDSMLLECL